MRFRSEGLLMGNAPALAVDTAAIALKLQRAFEKELPMSVPASVFEHPSFDNHEKVLFATDPQTGLQTIIAVHSTVRGPAVGGCRMWAYETSSDAVTDVLRLSGHELQEHHGRPADWRGQERDHQAEGRV